MSALSIILPWFIGTVIFVAIALAVVYFLAVSRRTPTDWQQHVKEHREAFSQTSLKPSDDPVAPRAVSLAGMLEARTEVGDGYYNPQHLPGFDRIETATERIEQRIAEQRTKDK